MSRNPYRLSFPKRGWAAVSWHHEHHLPPSLRKLALEASKVPGVQWGEDWSVFRFPETAFMVDAVRAFLEGTSTLDIFETRRPRARGAGLPELRDMPRFGDLYPWQVQAVHRAIGSGRGLLLCDQMGLGKTAAAIAACEVAANAIGPQRPRIVVAPGFTRDSWKNELLRVGAIEDESQFCALATRDFQDASLDKSARWLFCHYDIAHAWSSKIAALGPRKPVAAVVDEVHWAKNPKAKRSRGAHLLAAVAPFRMLLTGTPMDNRVGELYMPLSILTGAGTWGSHVDFRVRYAGAVHTGFGHQDQKPTHVAELQQRMEPYYLRRTLEDIDAGALPTITRERLSVEMDASTLRAHHDIGSTVEIAEMVDALLSGRAGDETLRRLTELRQLTSAAKERATIEYVKNLLDQDENVVVFCWQRATAQRIANALHGVDVWPPPTCVTGADSQATRDALLDIFRRDGGALVATYGVLREGVTLTNARCVVLHDLDWKPSTLLQAEARVYRLGQLWPVISTWVMAEDSIDTILARLLLLKAAHIEKTLGIEAPASVMDELDLGAIAGFEDIQEWASDMLEGWLG